MLERNIAAVQRPAIYWLYGVGCVLLLLSGILWWTKVWVQPERVFWGAVANNLTTAGVTLEVSSKEATMTDQQIIQYSLGATNKVHARRTLTQGGATVKTESVGDARQTFTRYTSIKTTKQPAGNQKTSIDTVTNIWARSDSPDSPELLSQTALGLALPLGAVPMPIGWLSGEDRERLMAEMRNRTLYQTSYTVKKESKNNRLLYTYNVEMQPVLYLKVMQSFAKTAGLSDLEGIDPNDYVGREPIQLSLTIDARSHRLVKVVNKSIAFEQRYTGYGVAAMPSLPSNAISYDELQKRLGAIE